MCREIWPKSPRGAVCENKAIVGVKPLGGHIKAVGVASSLHQEACKLCSAETDRRQSVLISDLPGGKKKGGLNTEGLKGAAAGWEAVVELCSRSVSVLVEGLAFINHIAKWADSWKLLVTDWGIQLRDWSEIFLQEILYRNLLYTLPVQLQLVFFPQQLVPVLYMCTCLLSKSSWHTDDEGSIFA